MLLLPPAPQRTRLRHLLLLLLLALGLLAGVSVSESRQAEVQLARNDPVRPPAVKPVHLLAAHVDALRGMAALHLAMHGESDRSQLEERLQGARVQLDRLLAGLGQRPLDDTDRQHHATVAASLAAFWAAQDQVLAASRRAHADPAAAALARQLLAGEAQRAYQRLRADIDAWMDAAERAAARSAQAAHAHARLLTLLAWAQATLAAAALAVALLLNWRVRRPLPPSGAAVPGATPATAPVATALDSAAVHAHLQALNDAVVAARHGDPERASGLSALQAECLAEQVDAATQGLRRLIDGPAATAPQRSRAAPAPDAG